MFNTTKARAKGRHLRRDPRVSVLVWQRSDPYRYIEVEGIAELDEDGAIAHIHKLSHKYRGTDFPRPEDRLIVRISPSRIHDEARSGSGGRSFRPAGRRLRLADLTASPWAWLPPASSMFGQRLRGETRELLFQPDQQLSQQPREFGLLLFGQCGEHASLGLEVAGSDACDEGSPFAGEGDEQSAAVVGVGDALDQALLLEPVEEVGHPARGAHQGAVELGRGATVGRSDAAESSQDVPARAAQPKAAEVAVQAAIEQRTRTADPCHDRDRRGVESWLFRPPLGQD